VPRRPLLRLAIAVAALGATTATAVAAVGTGAAGGTTLRVTAFTLTQVNQETRRLAPDAHVAMCQAIPFTELAPHVRWFRAPRGGLRATVELSVPGHRDRPLRRSLRPTARSGVRRVVFTPAALDDRAFPAGRYVVRVLLRPAEPVHARAELRLVTPDASSC